MLACIRFSQLTLVKMRDMYPPHRRLGQEQRATDLCVGGAVAEQRQHLELARRQRTDASAGIDQVLVRRTGRQQSISGPGGQYDLTLGGHPDQVDQVLGVRSP